MERKIALSIGVLALLAFATGTSLGAGTYYPYQSYDDYYKTHSVNPPPPPPVTQRPTQPPPEVKPPPPPPDQPIMLVEPPTFLFPSALGYGVAVGVPYDMYYTSKAFYFLKGGVWYRAVSYRGPWTEVPLLRVPPELRKHSLSKVHQIRNAEFAKYWKSKGRYQGKVFRPSEEMPPPSAKEKEKNR